MPFVGQGMGQGMGLGGGPSMGQGVGRDADPKNADPKTLAAPEQDLDSHAAEIRWRAVHALSGKRDTMNLLLGRLSIETDANVRAALFGALVASRAPNMAAQIVPFLNSDDPGLRNGAIEALKQLEASAASAVDALLGEDDPDLRLLAIEVTRAWPRLLALPRLMRILNLDEDVNVCAAAVDVATENGTEELLLPLAQLRRRFANQPFLVFAIDVARSRIQTAGAGR